MTTIPTTDLYTFGGNTDLLEEFERREVRFLVVGGLAVQFHAPEREADDLDLLLDPSPDNASRVLAALQSLPNVDCPFKSADLQKPKVQIRLKHLNYYADLLTPDSNTDFAAQWESASVGRVNKVPVRIASRAYLISMKSQRNGRKDDDDLKLLDPAPI